MAAELLPFLAADEPGGVTHQWLDNDDGTFRVVSSQDVGPAIEFNKQACNWNDGYSKSREIKRVAFIPDIIAYKWLQEEGWSMYDPNAKKQLARKLQDPDWAYLRTAPGNVAYSNGRIR